MECTLTSYFSFSILGAGCFYGVFYFLYLFRAFLFFLFLFVHGCTGLYIFFLSIVAAGVAEPTSKGNMLHNWSHSTPPNLLIQQTINATPNHLQLQVKISRSLFQLMPQRSRRQSDAYASVPSPVLSPPHQTKGITNGLLKTMRQHSWSK